MLSVLPSHDVDFGAALDGSACLGAWTHDVSADRFGSAPLLGDALGLASEELAGMTLARLVSAIHAEDGSRIAALFAASLESGGPFEAEFRTRDGGRWLRLMGRTDLGGERQAARACGLAFDLTEGRLGRGGPARRAQWQANQLAEHVIAMKGLVPRLDNPGLARLVDRLAVEIGFELARRLVPSAANARHH
ncbi:PAS domain-containing protein [Methylobacterium sp. C25]|uniref:PAS domain-containing protein n=1 Tax=Methylobacterium sp. C25 TaxID=2721622 RepID=UPI001F1FEED8|nr:PAS domain-containing protein [Methylobacterium sp. C25]MCE4224775.1 PAS domain-containing protein [Methylobacterium sp. C25]